DRVGLGAGAYHALGAMRGAAPRLGRAGPGRREHLSQQPGSGGHRHPSCRPGDADTPDRTHQARAAGARYNASAASLAGSGGGWALKSLEGAARSKENIMPAMLEAVQAYATIGEICDTLTHVFGLYSDPAVSVVSGKQGSGLASAQPQVTGPPQRILVAKPGL